MQPRCFVANRRQKRREDMEDAPQHTRADPLLKPLVAGPDTTDSGPAGRPTGSGPQDPQDAIEYGAVLPPRAPSTVFAARQVGQEGPNEVPLLVREVTGITRSSQGHPNTNGLGRSLIIAADERPATATASTATESFLIPAPKDKH
jgi:hypothetical protein